MEDKQPTVRTVARASVLIDDKAYDCVDFDPRPADSVDTVETRTVGAGKTIYTPGAITNTDAVEINILEPSSPSDRPVAGTMVTLRITESISVNGGEPSDSPAIDIPCFVQKVLDGKIQSTGADRKKTLTVTLQPTNIQSSP